MSGIQVPLGWKNCERHGYYTTRTCPKCIEENDHHPDSARTPSKPEPAPKRERVKLADGAAAEETSPERVHLRVESVRKRLCDPDNLVVKWHIDCLRYCGILKDDSAKEVSLEVTQRKTAKGEAEHTRIEIIFPEIERQPPAAV